MADNKPKIRLQGHEKFALREGWLNKGLLLLNDNPTVFLGKEGPDVFGIGNNMVKSLRYWLKAFGLIEEKPGKGAYLSSLAKIINEYDPYLEDLFTWWVLHSYISKNHDEATTWYMFFNRCDVESLNKEQILHILNREIDKYSNGQIFSEKSLKSDVDVLLNMYSKNKDMVDPEDKSTSPFAMLDLVRFSEGQYVKNCPDRRKVSEWNLLYELAILMDEKDSISIERVMHGDCSVSAIYHMTSVTINEFLDKLDALGYIRVDRTAGLDMIYRKKDFSAEQILKDYYEK